MSEEDGSYEVCDMCEGTGEGPFETSCGYCRGSGLPAQYADDGIPSWWED